MTSCTNQQPPQRGGAVPDSVWVGSKWLLAFPTVPVTPGTPVSFSRIHSCFFSDWRRTVSSKLFDMQVPSISTEELLLPCCVLSRLRCNGHSFLLSSYIFRIGRIENPSCSAGGHLSLHSALSSYGLFGLSSTFGPAPVKLPGF